MKNIRNSMVFVKESEAGHLPGLYYLVCWKSNFKEKNTWKPASAAQHLQKLLCIFYHDNCAKLTVTFFSVNTAPLIARPSMKLTKPLEVITKGTKRKRGQPVKNNTNKKSKKNLT